MTRKMSVQDTAATKLMGSRRLSDPQNCMLLLARATAKTTLETQIRIAMNMEVRLP